MRDHKPIGINYSYFVVLIILALNACRSTPPAPATTSLVAEPVSISSERVETPAVTPVTLVAVTIKPNYPDRYVIKRGDTLWDISNRFLKDPWLWPEVWHINPTIRNPHLIYPGDVVVLYYIDGKPYLTLEGAGGVVPQLPKGVRTVKLSPRIAIQSLEKSIAALPREVVAPFLTDPRIVTENELEAAPYILSSYEQHLITGTGHKIYVRGIKDGAIGNYVVVRRGVEYRDPDSNELLGYEAINAADVRLLKLDDPSSMRITKARLEVFNGDRLLPFEEQILDFNFFPSAPDEDINGRIIAVYNGVTQIGQFNVVVINKGVQNGLKQGHVLAIYRSGERARDNRENEYIKLPDEPAGLMMVFRIFDRLSFALVMEAYRPMKVMDSVRNP